MSLSAVWHENDDATPDPRPTDGEVLVRMSAEHGRARVLRWLAEQGVDLLAGDDRDDGWTATLDAALYGQFECVRCVVEHAGVEVLRAVDSSGDTCAHHAADKGQLPMLQWVVDKAGTETL